MSKLRTEKGKPKKLWVKVVILSVLSLLLAGGAFAAYMMNEIRQTADEVQVDLERGGQSDFREISVEASADPVSILVLGLDTRDGDLSGRTDAMVLLTFNPSDSTIKMLNIPRDSLVDIPGRVNDDKINHAHAFGGIDLTIDTVENFLDIPVDYFVSLNFDAFMEIIDEMGGITVDAPMEVRDTDNATYGTIVIPEGEQHINGEEALAYVRMRKHDPDGDHGRGERQKEVIESVIREMASYSTIANFRPLLDSVERNVNTNVEFSTAISMHDYVSELNNIASLSFEGRDRLDNDVYYFLVDEESRHEVSEELRYHLELTDEIEPYYVEEESSAQSDYAGDE